MAEFPATLARHLPAIERTLQEELGQGPDGLTHCARYVLGWEDAHGAPTTTGGKRIRPALCLFAATLFGQPAEVALPGAVAVELVHNFSLVHDEIQDHDAERHHRPTLWALLGEAQAINAGDFLYSRAFHALLRVPSAPERTVAALDVLGSAVERMIGGQWSDISFESRDDVTPEEYIAMVRGKTGALLGAPLAIGALLAGAGTDEAAALQEWGETVGLAFQVQDDFLGIWGEPDLTGKSNTNDIARRKKTLPIIHGIGSPAGTAIREVYASDDTGPEATRKVVAALEAAGSGAFCRSEGARLVDAADRMLASFELPERSRGELAGIGRYLLDRDR